MVFCIYKIFFFICNLFFLGFEFIDVIVVEICRNSNYLVIDLVLIVVVVELVVICGFYELYV